MSWLNGIDMARNDPALAAKTRCGELPVLAWKGGASRPLKIKEKIRGAEIVEKKKDKPQS